MQTLLFFRIGIYGTKTLKWLIPKTRIQQAFTGSVFCSAPSSSHQLCCYFKGILPHCAQPSRGRNGYSVNSENAKARTYIKTANISQSICSAHTPPTALSQSHSLSVSLGGSTFSQGFGVSPIHEGEYMLFMCGVAAPVGRVGPSAQLTTY